MGVRARNGKYSVNGISENKARLDLQIHDGADPGEGERDHDLWRRWVCRIPRRIDAIGRQTQVEADTLLMFGTAGGKAQPSLSGHRRLRVFAQWQAAPVCGEIPDGVAGALPRVAREIVGVQSIPQKAVNTTPPSSNQSSDCLNSGGYD
jgi:hypothetical protein